MYKYETHLHTKEGSACSSASAEDMARLHKEMGYDGIFVTNHFFNGNTSVPRELPWEERVDRYCEGYEIAKRVGDEIGLKVFFGVEYCVYNADFLIYNIDKEWLKRNERLLTAQGGERECFREIRSIGGFIVHAHPFRTAEYIHHISLYPYDIDAVEVINASHSNEMYNQRAEMYADMYGLPKTGGSDSHHTFALFGGGVSVPEPINTPEDYLHHIQSGTVVPLKRAID